MTNLFSRFVRDESGATAIEYGLIAALIAVVVIGAVTAVGTKLAEGRELREFDGRGYVLERALHGDVGLVEQALVPHDRPGLLVYFVLDRIREFERHFRAADERIADTVDGGSACCRRGR